MKLLSDETIKLIKNSIMDDVADFEFSKSDGNRVIKAVETLNFSKLKPSDFLILFENVPGTEDVSEEVGHELQAIYTIGLRVYQNLAKQYVANGKYD